MDYRAGMFFYALAFLLGDVFVQQLTSLPSHAALTALFFTVCLLFIAVFFIQRVYLNKFISRYITLSLYFILLFLIGILYTSLYAEQRLSNRLDESLIGKNLLVSGYVSNIPVVNKDVQRFTFDVESVQLLSAVPNNSHSNLKVKYPGKIRLSWYYGKKINASEKWQFEIRLKPPHGFMNPGGFDYESWLFQNGIDATGYVRKSELNQRNIDSSNNVFSGYINSHRQMLGRLIDSIAHRKSDADSVEEGSNSTEDSNSLSLIKALAIGDKSSITNKQWLVLINTGTSHLMAISGMHIGLAALFAYVLIRRLTPVYIVKHVPAQHVALAGGMFVALLYALIAGLSIPTQRAIVMLFVVSVMMLIRRNHRPIDALGFALIIILIVDPLSVLAVGFWFSFAAVAVIFISLRSGSNNQQADNESVTGKTLSLIKPWVKLQLTISIFLLPLSLFMFQQVSLVSPLANFILIPYISFLVVPVVLLAIVITFLSPDIAVVLFTSASKMIDFVWPALNYLSTRSYALWVDGEVDIFILLIATVVVFLVFSGINSYFYHAKKYSHEKRRTLNRYFVIFALSILVVPIFAVNKPGLKTGEYIVSVLDVGQGSAAVLQTQHHTIVFDAGAKFSDRLDVGRSVIIPYLRSQGVDTLDYLIISHGDSDHIGGAQAIIDEFPSTTVIGQDIEKLKISRKQHCFDGVKWQWDGVYFEFLSPPLMDELSLSMKKRNNRSCVLRVSSNYGSVLFTGDIEKKAERVLLEKHKRRLLSDVLVVPHHGSNTSSSMSFINAVKPVITLFSVGYKNRYKLPNHKVINRYSSSDSTIIQTAKSGAITIRISDETGIEIEKYREIAGKYWNHTIK